MGKKTKQELEAEAEEVGGYLSAARKMPQNFALLVAAAGVVLKAHPHKSCDGLWRDAKADGGGAKGAKGIMNVSGKIIQLTCETNDFPPGLPKQAKRHFQTLGLSVSITMALPGGKVLSDESDDGPGTGPTGGAGTGTTVLEEATGETVTATVSETTEEIVKTPVDLERKKVLTERLMAAAQGVKALGEDKAPLIEKLGIALRQGQSELKADNLDEAENIIEVVEKTLIPKPPAPPKGPAPLKEPTPEPTPEDLEKIRTQLRDSFKLLAADLALFTKRGEPSLAGKATQLANAFTAGIDGTDLKRMAQLVSTLKNFLAAYVPNLPPVSSAEAARNAIEAAKGQRVPAERYAKAMPVQKKYRAAAVTAADAFDKFAAVLGDQEVTAELLKTAKADIATVSAEMTKPKERLEAAKKLPAGPERDKAVLAAEGDVAAIQVKIDAAKAFEKAARGKKALTAALTFGPLSPDSAQTFSDEAASKLIAAFTRDPDLAVAAVGAAETAKYPDALAAGVDSVITSREKNFSDGTKAFADPAFSEKYAKQLLTMGGDAGPEFFARMDGYITSGRQFLPDPMGDANYTEPGKKAQIRSAKVGGALLGSDGKLDLTSQKAKDAIGDMLFSPISLAKPMPAMNEHVLKTVAMLSDPTNGAKANDILDKVQTPPATASAGLVRTALNKGTTAVVGKDDVQTAVMASMLKPITQGPVGSCFATAPVRQMRELNPLLAMQAYSDVASKGKYKPANGPEVPVVTKLPANEDPIMRSLEYTLATSASRTESSREKEHVQTICANGLNNLAIDIKQVMTEKASEGGGFLGFGKGVIQLFGIPSTIKAVKKQVSDAFDFVYDPTSVITDSSDGSSSSGRYVMIRKDTGAEITSASDYTAVVADIAVRISGFAPNSPEGIEVRNLATAQGFIDSVKNGDDTPWTLRGGGYGESATATLVGPKIKAKETIKVGKKTDTEGERTTEVLSSLLGSFDAKSPDMVILETVGQHAFNALPNDPSLAKLTQGGKGKFAENIKTHLVDKGKEIAATTMPAEKAQFLFDKMVEAEKAKITDPTLLVPLERDAKTHRPAADMTPAQLTAAVETAMEAYMDQKSLGYTNPAKAATFFKGQAKNASKTVLARDLGAPEFVVADTNWGSAENHVTFVIAPDPTTGEPLMWKKTTPPGSLVPAGRDWVDRKWQTVK